MRRRTHHRYKALFDNMSEAFALIRIIVDEDEEPCDYRFLEVNKAWEGIFNIPREKVVNKRVLELNPELEHYWINNFGMVAATNKPILNENFVNRLGKWIRVNAYPSGEKGIIAAIMEDITDRKQADEEKNNFISIMSHELRNPLTTVILGLDLLKGDIKDQSKTPREFEKSIKMIEEEAKNMTHLLDDLLDISRITLGKIKLSIKEIDLNESIRNAVLSTKPLVRKQRHKLFVSVPQNSIYLQADPARIEQIVVNLLNNAAKYTKPGGKIWLKVNAIGKEVEISVRDNGIGIEKKNLNLLFNPFSRFAVPFISTKGELGIGLKLIKDIVSLHNGSVTVKSPGKDKGSEFIVKLPIFAQKVQGEIISHEEIPEKKGLKILVVDDNKNIVQLIKSYLERHDHKIKTAYDGNAALSAYKTFKPDVALIDIGLPEMDGYTLAREIDKAAVGRKPKLIAITGYGQKKDKDNSRAAGFDVHLVKPINLETLNKTISQLLDKKNGGRP